MHEPNPMRRRFTSSLSGLAFTLIAGFSATSMAGTVELSTKPPEASTSVAPNLVLTFDDSGSMNWHHSPDQRPYDGAGWATGNDGSQTDLSNRTYPSGAAPFLCAGVITPGVTDPADPRSWSMNGVYFNPDNTYDPPLKSDKTAMPDSPYDNAWDNGIKANRPDNPDAGNSRDLGDVQFCNGKNTKGAGYFRYTGDKASLPLDGNGRLTAGAKTTLFTKSNWEWVALTTDADKQNFANWYSYYHTRTMAAVTAMSRAYAPLDKNVRVAWQNINSNFLSNGSNIFKFVNGTDTQNVRDRFYTWLFAMPATGGTPNRSAAIRVGKYFSGKGGQNGSSNSNPYFDKDLGKELVCRQNFHIQMTDGMWNSDTPSSPGGNDTTSIANLPDGRAFSTSEDASKVVWNESDNSIVTMADIAFYYWSHDLQATMQGVGGSAFGTAAQRLKVPPHIVDTSTNLFGTPWVPGTEARDNKEIYWNPANDPATWPHLVQYMIGFGASGQLPHSKVTYDSLRKGTVAWPVPSVGTDDGRKIDDMWHAALNSRGEFFAASSPSELIAALQKIISGIISRSTVAVAGSLGSSVLSAGAVTYRAGYDTNDWTGTLTSNAVDINGKVSAAPLWDGRDLLDARAPSSRVILTSTAVGAGNGAAFTGNAVVNAINAVDPNFGSSSSTPSGTDRLAWLRGDKSKEGTSFRQRNHLLGAILNAQTLYVAQPASGYRNMWPKLSPEATAEAANTGYAKFVADHAKRAPTVYVAANDGMLHAFDATTAADVADPTRVDVTPSPGKERWAYVPYSAYGKLATWSSLTSFDFQPSVDGTPVSRDVYFNSGSKGWHTILVAGLRYGGRGVYALDITDASASEGAPNAKVLWEFNNTSTGGANLGYTFGRPNISRLANGQWVVVVPSGYMPTTNPAVNCTASPTDAACIKYSSLFVLDAQTGALIKEIQTPTSVSGVTGTVESYGLSTPVMGDYTGDQIDDVAFAGDLQGNIWRFDLTGTASTWKAELFFRSSDPGDRPVTVMPRLFADPIGGGMVVVFGTGKYLASSDNIIDSNTKQQVVYGIRDSGKTGQTVVIEGASATPLVQQTLTEVNSIRGLTTNAVPAKTTGGVTIRGWFFNLYVTGVGGQLNKGERVVVDATALSDTNRAIITTLIPQDNDPCDPAPRGAVMFVDAATGGAAAGVSFGSQTGWPNGYQQAGALVKNPPTGGFLPVATSVGGGKVFLPGLTLLDDTTTPSAGAPIWRRRSWRVLNNDQ